MVALNYQTEDVPMHINKAMFEENNSCGYVRKPDVIWNRSHLMYRRFNPMEKEFDGIHVTQLVLNVVSGQYLNQANLFSNTFIEIELLGIPSDCTKRKTKTIRRNSFNPLWNETFYFKILFYDLAFLKFSVFDADTGLIIAQRVISLKCMRPGYRHVRLRSPTNQPLHMASLFVYTRVEEEGLDRSYDEIDDQYIAQQKILHAKEKYSSEHSLPSTTSTVSSLDLSISVDTKVPQLKRKMFFLMVYDVVPDKPYTILKITQESTTKDVVVQAIQKMGKSLQCINEYILMEEVYRGWEKKDRILPPTQRVLDMGEKPLQAQGNWRGEGRFILKKIGTDPSSRAWVTSIKRTAERRSSIAATATVESTADELLSLENLDNFLVCIYNVSQDIPYAILRVPIKSTAQDVLAQALLKARRMDNPHNFVLVEELTNSNKCSDIKQRILGDDENVHKTQASWKAIGRFVIHERSQLTPSTLRKTILPIEKISKGFCNMSSRGSSSSSVHSLVGKSPIQIALSDPLTSKIKNKSSDYAPSSSSRKHQYGHHYYGNNQRTKFSSEKDTPTTTRRIPRSPRREVHSEGETLSDEETRETDIMSRLKRLSIKKLKSWKS